MTYWINFAREVVAKEDGLVETLLMYEQLHSLQEMSFSPPHTNFHKKKKRIPLFFLPLIAICQHSHQKWAYLLAPIFVKQLQHQQFFVPNWILRIVSWRVLYQWYIECKNVPNRMAQNKHNPKCRHINRSFPRQFSSRSTTAHGKTQFSPLLLTSLNKTLTAILLLLTTIHTSYKELNQRFLPYTKK